jgi:hypothetical protein
MLEKADAAKMPEKADAAEMAEKADTEMAEKADIAVEKGDMLETLASNLNIPLATEWWSSWLLPARKNPLHPQGGQASAAQICP